MIEVNLIAILLASVAGMAVGFFWYGPMLFGKRWMKLMGYTEASMKEDRNKMGKYYGISFVLMLVTAFVLWHVMTLSLTFFAYTPFVSGITSAFWMWIGFIMPVQATDVLFGKKTWELFGINTGYQLASVFVMGIVLSFFI